MTKWVGSMCPISDNTSKWSLALCKGLRGSSLRLWLCINDFYDNDNLTEWPCTCDILHSDLNSSWLVGFFGSFGVELIASSPPPFNAL